MKRDLLIAGVLVAFAGLGIVVVVMLPSLQFGDEKPKTVKPKPEPIAQIQKKEEPKKPVVLVKDEPIQVVLSDKKKVDRKTPIEKEPDPEIKKPEEKKIAPKVDKEPIEPKKIEPPVEVKIEPKKTPGPAKFIPLGDDLAKLWDDDGDYTVKSLHGGRKLELIGKIKTLKIADINNHSTLDLKGLIADEIVFLGQINNSTVILGKARSVKIRDINDHSTLDGSALGASVIQLTGAVNSSSKVLLHAPKGTVEFHGEINDRSEIDIAAPEGKVVFKGRGDSVINGNAKLTIVTRELDFAGSINGMMTWLDITLTKDGSLKARRINGSVRLHYRKADAADPELRIDASQTDTRADFKMVPAIKK